MTPPDEPNTDKSRQRGSFHTYIPAELHARLKQRGGRTNSIVAQIMRHMLADPEQFVRKTAKGSFFIKDRQHPKFPRKDLTTSLSAEEGEKIGSIATALGLNIRELVYNAIALELSVNLSTLNKRYPYHEYKVQPLQYAELKALMANGHKPPPETAETSVPAETSRVKGFTKSDLQTELGEEPPTASQIRDKLIKDKQGLKIVDKWGRRDLDYLKSH